MTEVTNWALDPAHSEVQFKVKHLMITNVTGTFNVINASLQSENADFNGAKVSFTADAASVSTGSEQRDGHLKSADFFDVENHPEIKFESGSYNPAEGKIAGNLTMHGVTQPVTFDAEFHGVHKDPWGNEKAGFSLSGIVKRTDFGLNWNAALEAGGVLVSEDVKITADVQFGKQA